MLMTGKPKNQQLEECLRPLYVLHSYQHEIQSCRHLTRLRLNSVVLFVPSRLQLCKPRLCDTLLKPSSNDRRASVVILTPQGPCGSLTHDIISTTVLAAVIGRFVAPKQRIPSIRGLRHD